MTHKKDMFKRQKVSTFEQARKAAEARLPKEARGIQFQNSEPSPVEARQSIKRQLEDLKRQIERLPREVRDELESG